MPESIENQFNFETISNREKEMLEFEIETYNNAKAEFVGLMEYIEKEKKEITAENEHEFSPGYLDDIRKDSSGIQAETRKQIQQIDRIIDNLKSVIGQIK
jgi:serine kinase of HPr protein (carbohydrate metabolism regulator)